MKKEIASAVVDGVRAAAGEIAATKEVMDKNKMKLEQEKRSVIEKYHNLLTELLINCEKETEYENEDMGNGMFLTVEVEEKIYKSANKVIRYYQQHRADLDIMEQYHDSINRSVMAYPKVGLLGNEELRKSVREAKTAVAKALL